MRKSLVLLAIGTTALLIACGKAAEFKDGQTATGERQSQEVAASANRPAAPPSGIPGPAGLVGGSGAMPAFPAATPAPSPERDVQRSANRAGGPPSQLDTFQRQVISTATLSIEVTAVQAATSQVRAIAEGLGGFVEQLSSSGDAKTQQASMTIRVAQPQFFTAMERLEALGKVQNRNLGSEDVSSQFIDLKARLASGLREEQSLLSLLGKASNVTEILTIERELTRVRSEIERLQGQLNYLERRVELATISVSLFPPQEESVQPPSGSLTVEVNDVTSKVAEVRSLMVTLGGKVDGVSLRIRENQQIAQVSLRVFDDKFDPAVTSLESLGEVTEKQLQQGASPTGLEKDRPEQPNAPIVLTLVKPVEESKAWLWWAIGGPIGGVALLALAVVLVYRAGSRRRA